MRLIRIFLCSIALFIVAAGATTISTPEEVDNGTSIVFVFDRDFAPFTY